MSSLEQHEGGQKPEEIELKMGTSPEGQAHEKQNLMSEEHDEELKQEDIEKIHFFEKVQMESDPNLWANIVVQLPCCCILFSYIFLAGMVVACLAGKFYKFDKPYFRDYLIWDDPIVKNWDMRDAGMAYIESLDSIDKSERFTVNNDWSATFIYENKKEDTGLLGNLDKIKAFEKEIADYGGWKDYCLAKSVDDPSCNDDYIRTSLKGFVDLKIGDSVSAADAKANLVQSIKFKDKWSILYADLFQKDVVSNAKTGKLEKVEYMRSIFKIGMPLKDFKGPHDRPDEQKQKVIEFLKGFNKLMEGKNELWESRGLQVRMYAPALDDLAFDQALFDDVPWVAASFIFFFLWLILHTNSFILSFVSLTVLILTFPVGMVIYEGVFYITYMSGMHLVTVFIVIAVSLNNILVLFDTWYQTRQLCPHIFDQKLQRRMAFVLRRCTSGLFMTCATQTVVILGNAWNPIMPVKSIAMFSGILVVSNFFIVLMIIPPTLVIYDKIENNCCTKGHDHDDEKQQADIHSLDEQYSGIDRFFGEKWNKCTSNILSKLLLFLLFLAWTAGAAYKSMDIKFKTYVDDFLPEENPTQFTKNLYNTQFFGAEDQPRIYFVWGVNDLDQKDMPMWNSRSFGKADIDRNFDPIEKETFSQLMDFCTDLQSQRFVEPDSVDCWIQDLYEYTQQQGIQWVPSNEFAAQNYFLQWLRTTDSGKIARDQQKVGIVDDKITFMQISALSGVKKADGLGLKLTEYDLWEKFTTKWQAKLPVTAKSIIQTSHDAWGWIPTQQSIEGDSINGVIIAAAFCFIILLFTTQNIVITILGILCLFSIFVSLLALMTVMKWKLGLLEVLLLVVVMGLSVDNTVHIAHDYTVAPQFNRAGKMKQAYLQKGKTLTSSSVSVALAACFLFGAKITIFYSYALVIIMTLVVSYIISMVFFGSLCHLLGPSSGCGDICGRLPGQEHEEELEMIRIKQEMQV